jgi:hypothetical protein
MHFSLHTRNALRLAAAGVMVSLQLSLALPATSFAQARPAAASSGGSCQGPADYAVAGGWFYTQQAIAACVTGLGPARARGYLVVDDAQANFWTEFRRYGGVEVLGYPVSQRYQYPPSSNVGAWYQAFERGILQWDDQLKQAHMANAFEQFTEAHLDAELDVLGIPMPLEMNGSAADPMQRMNLITEPRFLSRYFFDPVAFHSSEPNRPGRTAFATQEQAWDFFGLPQSSAEQLALHVWPLPSVTATGRAKSAPGPVSLYPLMHTFVAQRFQKGGLQLFLEDGQETFGGPLWTGAPSILLDPTVVPGDAVSGCVATTAVGLLARRVGAGQLIPIDKIQPLPLVPDNLANTFVRVSVPPLAAGQTTVRFEVTGSGFQPGEPISISLVEAQSQVTGSAPQPSSVPSVTRVPATFADGSFDTVLAARVGSYNVSVTGANSSSVWTSDSPISLAIPTLTDRPRQGTCSAIGLP